MSPNHCYSAYRQAMRSCNPPWLPSLDVLLTELTFIEEGHPTEVYSKHADSANDGQPRAGKNTAGRAHYST